MTTLNRSTPQLTTHEGGSAKYITPEQQLKRSVMACLLWEKEFYEHGVDIANRIRDLIFLVNPKFIRNLAIEARTDNNLRHIPLLMARWLAKRPSRPSERWLIADTIAHVIQRPDELAEFLAIYWKDGKEPLGAQVKKGLASAFQKFDEYSLAKYNRLDKAIKLRDVLFLCHAEPLSFEQDLLWKKLINGQLATPDTWEVEISETKDKRASWTRLLSENKLGGLALLRNLRNMQQANVDIKLIKAALSATDFRRVLPFRFIAASRYAPNLESELEKAMFQSLEKQANQEFCRLKDETILLVDVSRSMDQALSSKSDMKRIDAACGLAVMARELCSSVRIFTFSNKLVEVPNRRGFALRDAIISSQQHSATYLGKALTELGWPKFDKDVPRLIVFTDEQIHDKLPNLTILPRKYMINIASAKNGVGYYDWLHIDGFSESIIKFISANEQQS